MNPSTPIDRAEINRQNAAHSRGPITPEGKRRVSLNALRHGLTGHTVVLPSEDLAVYQKHCGQFHTELKPQGLIESKCVQTIADTYWRLERIRAMENSLFGLATSERTGEAVVRDSNVGTGEAVVRDSNVGTGEAAVRDSNVGTGEAVVRDSNESAGEAVVRGSEEEAQESEMSPDPLIDCALAQAKALEQHADLLTRLSLYEQRLNRTLEKTKAELRDLQRLRAQCREEALFKAHEIAKLKEALRQPWEPHEDGFEFSLEDLTVWMRRIELHNDAVNYRTYGRLPYLPAPVRRK